MKQLSRITGFGALCSVLILSSCGKIKSEATYPTRPEASGSDAIVYTGDKRDTIFGEGKSFGSSLFGGEEQDENAGGTGLGVNSFLWRASLDTISFMPVSSADPFGGVILTDWYENPEIQGERFKINIYILGRQLRSDGLRVSVFKQALKSGQWRDLPTDEALALNVENTILTRARELKVQQTSTK